MSDTPDDWSMRTERLLLRPLNPDDADVLTAYRNHEDVARYQDWELPYPRDRAEALIAEQQSIGWGDPGAWLQIAVELDGTLVGDVAVGWAGSGRRVTIGYSFGPEFQGRGLATEAVEAIVDRLLAEGVQRVDATMDPKNIASMRLLERLGFEYEGVQVGAALVRGEWLDDAVYGLTPGRRAAWLGRPRAAPDTVELVELTADNAWDYREPVTHHTQEGLVAPTEQSFQDALFAGTETDKGGGPLVPWLRGIAADGVPVGFVMMAEATATSPDPYLWRLLIDRRHQKRGIGSRVLAMLVEQARVGGHHAIVTSWEPRPGTPEPFYLGLGFVKTGEIDDGEIVGRISF